MFFYRSIDLVSTSISSDLVWHFLCLHHTDCHITTSSSCALLTLEQELESGYAGILLAWHTVQHQTSKGSIVRSQLPKISDSTGNFDVASRTILPDTPVCDMLHPPPLLRPRCQPPRSSSTQLSPAQLTYDTARNIRSMSRLCTSQRKCQQLFSTIIFIGISQLALPPAHGLQGKL